MRIISLNTWGGTLLDPLRDFITREGPSADVLLLQEVCNGSHPGHVRDRAHADLLLHLTALLPEHELLFDASNEYVVDPALPAVPYGLAAFVRRTVLPQRRTATFTHGAFATKSDGHNPRIAQVLTWEAAGQHQLTIIHTHGLHTGASKGDIPARLAQNAVYLRLLADGATGWSSAAT